LLTGVAGTSGAQGFSAQSSADYAEELRLDQDPYAEEKIFIPRRLKAFGETGQGTRPLLGQIRIARVSH